MKKQIHPSYKKGIKIKCICGAEHTVNSTLDQWSTLEICSKCHTAYNAGAKIDKVARGRLQAYQERMAKISQAQTK